MHSREPYWQSYWYVLRFRREGTASFEPMGPGGPQPVPNEWLANRAVDEFVDRLVVECADELDDLHGELRVLVYAEAASGTDTDTEPVLVRTVRLGRG